MDQFKELFEWYSEFEDDLSNPETYPMAAFQNFYLEMVQTLHDFVKSIKAGESDLHMYALEKMLHWFHAYKNYYYACHFSYYCAALQALAYLFRTSMFQHLKEDGF